MCVCVCVCVCRNFFFRQAYSLQNCYEDLKDFAVETEFITLFKEDVSGVGEWKRRRGRGMSL